MKKKYTILIFVLIIILFLSTAVSAAQIELQNGQILRGEVKNDSFQLKTNYGQLNIQRRYLNKLNHENGIFTVRAAENNKFSGELQTEIVFLTKGKEQTFAAAEIKSINFDSYDSFNDNKQISLTLSNQDFFFANTVEDTVSINTSLGSPLNLRYENIISIEYLAEENLYLIKRNNASDIKSDLSEQKIIVWPAAAEIIEINFDYIRKINFN